MFKSIICYTKIRYLEKLGGIKHGDLETYRWDISEIEAINLQQKLAQKVIKDDLFDQIQYVAGIDVAYSKTNDKLIAAIVVLESDSLNLVESVTVEDKVQFPYISGLFSFRELPPIIKAFKKIKTTPQLVVCDGQGLATLDDLV